MKGRNDAISAAYKRYLELHNGDRVQALTDLGTFILGFNAVPPLQMYMEEMSPLTVSTDVIQNLIHEKSVCEQRTDVVPGRMHRAKCNFELTRTNLYVKDGTTGPGDNQTEPCPNGCGPLWPVTWEAHARKGWEVAENYFEQLRAARAAVPTMDILVNRFLAWPLPASVCSDPCVTTGGYLNRYGTNLLTADEAQAMFEHVLASSAPDNHSNDSATPVEGDLYQGHQ